LKIQHLYLLYSQTELHIFMLYTILQTATYINRYTDWNRAADI